MARICTRNKFGCRWMAVERKESEAGAQQRLSVTCEDLQRFRNRDSLWHVAEPAHESLALRLPHSLVIQNFMHKN